MTRSRTSSKLPSRSARRRSKPSSAGSVPSWTTARPRTITPGSSLVGPAHPSGARRFVSRGGDKLDAALDAFGMDVEDALALDAGASSGGFTDCLLGRGAREVVAVDVAYGQLAWALRNDPRVQVLERTNVRTMTASSIGPLDLLVADLSFISLAALANVFVALQPDA